MKKAIANIPKLILSLNKKLNTKLLNKKNSIQIQEDIEELINHIKKLEDIITSGQNIENKEDCAPIIAYLYQHLSEVIQDFQNIRENMTLVCQKYAKEFLKNE